MVVTVIAMWMVQVPIDEVVDVIAVGDGFLTAVGPMYVAVLVTATCVWECRHRD